MFLLELRKMEVWGELSSKLWIVLKLREKGKFKVDVLGVDFWILVNDVDGKFFFDKIYRIKKIFVYFEVDKKLLELGMEVGIEVCGKGVLLRSIGGINDIVIF